MAEVSADGANAIERNLLAGVLALQVDLIDDSQLAEACQAWAGRQQDSLAGLLVERGWITPDQQREVEGLLERKLKKLGGDTRLALGVNAGSEVRPILAEVSDPEISKTLNGLPALEEKPSVESTPPAMESAGPGGLTDWLTRNSSVLIAVLVTLTISLLVLSHYLQYRRTEGQIRQLVARVDELKRPGDSAPPGDAPAPDQATMEALVKAIQASPVLGEPTAQEEKKTLLAPALEYYKEQAARAGTSPTDRARRADALHRLASLQDGLDAEGSYRDAVKLWQALAKEFPKVPAYRQNLAAAHYQLGLLYQGVGDRRKAGEEFGKALDLQRELTASDPEKLDWQADLGQTLINLAHLAQLNKDSKQAQQAAKYLGEALDILKKTVDKDARKYKGVREPHKVAVQKSSRAAANLQTLGTAQNNLGLLYQKFGSAKADKAFQNTVAVRDLLAKALPAVPVYQVELADTFENLANVYRKSSPDLADTPYQEALTIRTELAARHPGVPSYRQKAASTLQVMADYYQETGDSANAEAVLMREMRLRKQLATGFPERDVFVIELGDCYLRSGKAMLNRKLLAKALDYLDGAVQVLKSRTRDETALPLFLDALEERAHTLAKLARWKEALADWDDLIMRVEDKRAGEFRCARCVVLAQAGNHAEAMKEVAELSSSQDLPPAACVDLARASAVALAAVRKGDKKKEEDYAALAMQLMDRAEKAGYFADAGKIEHMEKDADLAALRDRPEFKKWLASLKKSD